MVNDNFSSGAGQVIIRVDRWSAITERDRLVNTLLGKGPDKLLDVLQDMKPVGIIKTPDSLGYDLHYAHQNPGEDGGRDIVIATDRPIGFWEASHQPRTIDYPFTVIQMHINKDGKGTGTLSYATKVSVVNHTVVLENFSSAPVMLTQVESRLRRSN